MQEKLPQLKISERIREINFQGLRIGGDASVPFMQENDSTSKPLLALELPFFYEENFPLILKKQYGENYEITDAVKKAESLPNDLLSIRFNIREDRIDKDFAEINDKLDEIFEITKKPLILRGKNNNDIDKKLLPFLAKRATRQCIISFVEDTSYEDILPSLIENNHITVIRTPIDINLAKEMNILTTDKGLDTNKIIIDPDMGGLGYGLDYGFSIIEKLKQVGLSGDKMLNMPIIVCIGEESYKAKEAKSTQYSKAWGEYDKRAIMWELAGASAVIAAGANIVVLWSEKSLLTLKGVIGWN